MSIQHHRSSRILITKMVLRYITKTIGGIFNVHHESEIESEYKIIKYYIYEKCFIMVCKYHVNL